MREDYERPAGELRVEGEKVKGSRFLATVAQARDAAAAEAVVARVRRELHDARHHGFAYRIGSDGALFRSSDDGEPAGSTGRPILQQLEGAGLSDAVVVVTRWFGGTKLGVGGLVRAYGGAAARALERVPRERVVLTERVRVEHPYECSGAVGGACTALGLAPAEADYGESVRLAFDVPVGKLDAFLHELRERSGGRCRVSRAAGSPRPSGPGGGLAAGGTAD